MSDFAAQHSLFRAYDIRGDRQYFTPEFIEALGFAFATLYQAKVAASHAASATGVSNTVVIGYDVRCNSNTIADRLAYRLDACGLQVVRLGLVTTPMMAFWAEQYGGHGIMVTASHSAKNNLGIKWLIDNTSPSGGEIQQLYHQLVMPPLTTSCRAHCAISPNTHATSPNSPPTDTPHKHMITLPAHTVASDYIDAIAQIFARIHPNKARTKFNFRLVIDCMHGATSSFAHTLFSSFFTHVTMLNDLPNGNFPTGNPDPTEPNRLAELQQTVIVTEADLGLAFDGDGDRLMVVDNSGKVIAPDNLLYLLAQVALSERPLKTTTPRTHDTIAAPQVIFDVKCSHHLPILLKKLGAIPVMTRTGSSLLRQQLQRCADKAIFAGELSGHFIFNDGYHIAYDDAMYAGLRLLHWLLKTATPTNFGITDPQIITDVWGEPRDRTMPYTMTDITRHLPTLVSTADHYLPRPKGSACGCSLVRHLTNFCHHLQHLAEQAVQYERAPTQGTVTLAPTCDPMLTQVCLTPKQARQLLPLGTRLSCIDGIRLDFPHGFGVLRESNTSHSLTVRFAGDCSTDLQDVQARFVALCQPFDASIAAQIAAIRAE